MKIIVDIEILPVPSAVVTPCELLSDFADATPNWQFLDEETRHYRSIRGVAACLLRHVRLDPLDGAVDFAFAAIDDGEQSALSLVIIDIDDPNRALTLELRNEEIGRFARDFQAYLSRHDGYINIRIVEEEVEVSG
jgi:hypothetical protein